jgi:hypothetical protein
MKTRLIAPAALVVLSLSVTAFAQTCDEQVFLDTSNGTIAISHIQALYNCCCTIDTEVIQDDYILDVHEYEALEGGGCDCLCCFNLQLTIAGLTPGDYTVTIIKHSEYGGTEHLGPWIVTVTGTSEPSVSSAFVPCVDTAVQENETTWGVIKALYR